jgi:Protein of unknown function (DUF1573)
LLCYNVFMKKIIALLFVLLPTLAWSQPSIEFETDKHDFGFVRQGDLLEFNFEFTNAGTDILDIQTLNTS